MEGTERGRIGSEWGKMAESCEIGIEKIVEGGLGLARTDRGVVLTAGTLPGERVEIEPVAVREGVRFGKLRRVVEASPRRITPSCPLFLSCGGCDFLHTPYAHELELKQQILVETLARIGKLKPPMLPPAPARHPEYYRSFVQLKIDGNGRIGLFKRESHDVVAFEGPGFEGCKLQEERVNRAVAELQGVFCGFQVIKIRMGDEGLVVNVTSETQTGLTSEQVSKLRAIGATGILVNDQAVEGSPRVVYIYGEANGPKYRFGISHSTFAQSDSAVVQSIVNRLRETIQAEFGANRLRTRMLDLYAGAGPFGIMLASNVREVISVEISAGAVQDLETNIRENGIENILVYKSTTKAFLKRFGGEAGVVIVDPPRAGLEKEVRESLLKISAPLLFYISCHPATLARDLQALTQSGRYGIDSVQMFDQFGRCHHIESLTILKRIHDTQT